MPFQKGNKLGKGRPKKPRSQAKDWVQAHPYAVAELMQVLYEQGIDGDREAAMYVVDRIKGKPGIHTDITSDGERIDARTMIAIIDAVQRLRLSDYTTKPLIAKSEGLSEEVIAEH